MHHRHIDPVPLTDWVTITVRDAQGRVVRRWRFANTITDWARAAVANWLIGAPLLSGPGQGVSAPSYIALGTGTQTPSTVDVAMFGEAEGTRLLRGYSSVFQAFTAQVSATYGVGVGAGTWYEAGLWDGPTTDATLTAAVSAGATALPVTGAPPVYGGTQPGQYTTAYIADSTNGNEYVALAVSAAAGTATWTLQQGLQYPHPSGTVVHTYSGNLWAHVSLGAAGVTHLSTGQTLTVQWSLAIQAS